jgi:hypothetical protein
VAQLSVGGGGLSLRACLRYNDVAGPDKSPAHIAAITVAVLAWAAGQPGGEPGCLTVQAAPPKVILATLGVQGLALLPALLPFLIVKRAVSTTAFVAAWAGFISAAGIWFGAALVSLGIFLS